MANGKAMTVGEMASLFLDPATPVRIDAFDGSHFGPADADLKVKIATPNCMYQLLAHPNEIGIVRWHPEPWPEPPARYSIKRGLMPHTEKADSETVFQRHVHRFCNKLRGIRQRAFSTKTGLANWTCSPASTYWTSAAAGVRWSSPPPVAASRRSASPRTVRVRQRMDRP